MKHLFALMLILFILTGCQKDSPDVYGVYLSNAHDLSSGREYNGSIDLHELTMDMTFGGYITKHGIPCEVSGNQVTVGRKTFDNSFAVLSGTGIATGNDLQLDIFVEHFQVRYKIIITGNK